MYHQIVKFCPVCDKEIKGRTDKKFCGDYCRNYHNNQLKSAESNFVRNIINALRKNRLILQDMLGSQNRNKIAREKLLERGFQFKYYTHILHNRNGHSRHFCFDYGYQMMDENYLLLLKSNF